MLGTGTNAVNVVIILEFVLAVYSVALAFSTERKILKIVQLILAVMWCVMALMNLFT